MAFLGELLLFGAKVVLVLVAIALVLGWIAALGRRGSPQPYLDIENLNEQFQHLRDRIVEQSMPPKMMRRMLKTQLKERNKAQKKAAKEQALQHKRAKTQLPKKREPVPVESSGSLSIPKLRPRLFVLDFVGDVMASSAEKLRHEVSAILQCAETDDEVVIRLESPGGAVHQYGLASSQLARLREAGIKLTACVDRVAASGGYMMAVVADRIVAAPFAILGSIGVVAMVPNIHRLLRRFGVDYLEMTAGEYKRTLGPFTEPTEKNRVKFQQELEQTHDLFKAFVQRYRPTLPLKEVTSGEHWFGSQAEGLGLVDALQTSDDYLLEHSQSHDLLRLEYRVPVRLSERLGMGVGALMQALWLRFSRDSVSGVV